MSRSWAASFDPASDLGLFHAAHFQPESDVLADGHVGIEGVALEDHGDIARAGGHVVHDAVVDVDQAFGGIFQPGQHVQGGRFAAARGADQRQQLFVVHLQIEVDDGRGLLVAEASC